VAVDIGYNIHCVGGSVVGFDLNTMGMNRLNMYCRKCGAEMNKELHNDEIRCLQSSQHSRIIK